jgi:hypothetical protein
LLSDGDTVEHFRREEIRMPRRCLVALAVALCLGATTAVAAQQAAVEGVARAAEDGAPIPFALVRLIRADSQPAAQGITTADGRFRFGDVTAGSYRVLLLRIGYRPALSDPVQVAAGATAQLPMSVASHPIALPAVTVTAEPCITRDGLAAHPALLTLWQQARDGASIREGLMARFRYRSVLREEGVELTADGPTPVHVLDQPLVSDPRWAVRNAARIRANRLSRGYYSPNDGWGLPNELDVLHDDFLSAHCFEPSIERGEGEIGVRFRPLRTRRDFLDVRGTIWLDSASYLARRIDVEYVDGEEKRGTVRLDFGDVPIAGGTLRMPVGGAYRMRPSRKNPEKRTEGKLTYTYADFEEVRPR